MRSFISGILSLHLLWNYLDDKSVFKKLETCELARETTRNPLNKQFNTLNGEKFVFTAFPKTAKGETNTLNIKHNIRDKSIERKQSHTDVRYNHVMNREYLQVERNI